MKVLEKDIQRQILDWLQWQGVYCWKNHSTGIKKENGSWIPVGKKGVSDILGILKGGIFLAIEVKSKRGKITVEQQEFLDSITTNQGIAFVARSLEDCEKNLKDYFI